MRAVHCPAIAPEGSFWPISSSHSRWAHTKALSPGSHLPPGNSQVPRAGSPGSLLLRCNRRQRPVSCATTAMPAAAMLASRTKPWPRPSDEAELGAAPAKSYGTSCMPPPPNEKSLGASATSMAAGTNLSRSAAASSASLAASISSASIIRGALGLLGPCLSCAWVDANAARACARHKTRDSRCGCRRQRTCSRSSRAVGLILRYGRLCSLRARQRPGQRDAPGAVATVSGDSARETFDLGEHSECCIDRFLYLRVVRVRTVTTDAD